MVLTLLHLALVWAEMLVQCLSVLLQLGSLHFPDHLSGLPSPFFLSFPSYSFSPSCPSCPWLTCESDGERGRESDGAHRRVGRNHGSSRPARLVESDVKRVLGDGCVLVHFIKGTSRQGGVVIERENRRFLEVLRSRICLGVSAQKYRAWEKR